MPTEDPSRPLLGLTVGFSAARSEDATDPGFHRDELNRSVIRITQRLLVAGARIVVGHDWRQGGIMETLLKSPAIEHAASIGKPGAWAITNLVPDRGEPAPISAEIEELSQAGILSVEGVGLPEWWPNVLKDLPAEHRELARAAVGVLQLRVRMDQLCDARLCIGGKTRDFSGFYPGILEEGWRTASRGKALYVTALLGGASRLMAYASGWQPENRPKDFEARFRPSPDHVACYEALKQRLGDQKTILPDYDLLPVLSASDMNSRAGLSKEDWNLLIEAPTADAVGVMMIRGLAKVNSDS